MQDARLRDDARQLLRVAYERQADLWGRVTQVDLEAGADERGLRPASHRLETLVDYIEVMGWVEPDIFARGGSVQPRRITVRGLEVVNEGSGP